LPTIRSREAVNPNSKLKGGLGDFAKDKFADGAVASIAFLR
jgi:hypothetical protein